MPPHGNAPSNSVLSGVFCLSLLLLGLVPYTLVVLLSRKEEKALRVKATDAATQWGRAAAAQVGQPANHVVRS